MKYGFIIPRGDVHTIPELAEKVEAAGWDAVFIPDCISIETAQYPATEGYDPWIMLAVIAVRTQIEYEGEHYHVRGMTLLPPPVIPIWVVGAWPRMKSMQRALRYDGLLPNRLDKDGKIVEITPDDISAMKTYITEHRTLDTPFDIIWEGRTPGEDREKASHIVRKWEKVGGNGCFPFAIVTTPPACTCG